MAETQALPEVQQESASPRTAKLMVALPTMAESTALAAISQTVSNICAALPNRCQAVLALPGDSGAGPEPAVLEESADPHALSLAHFPPPAADPASIPWLAGKASYASMAALAGSLDVQACTVLGGYGPNQAWHNPQHLALLIDPVLERSFDLVMPCYTMPAFENLLNRALLYPLTRVLYGYRIEHPLAGEFQMSAKMCAALRQEGPRDAARQQGRLPWPATIAAARNLKMCQVRLGVRHTPAADNIELSDALAQLAGPLFLDMEDNAAVWQRVRGSHDVPTFGTADPPLDGTEPVDVRPMVEAFQLGVRSLRDVWALILPPLALLELNKIAHLTPDNFQLPDMLWARIVYDFALAHRLRNLHRAHLFGALTPLYLGWAASYAVEVNRIGIRSAAERLEQLARTFESEKPYLVSRWRWPDRFHP